MFHQSPPLPQPPPRPDAGAPFAAKAINFLEVLAFVLPAPIKLDVATRVRDWAQNKRLEALAQLGQLDPEQPAPPSGPHAVNTEGYSR